MTLRQAQGDMKCHGEPVEPRQAHGRPGSGQALTKAQQALLHTAKRDIGLDDDTYRDMLENVTGVRSSTEMTQRGFEALMKHLEARGFKKTPGAHDFTGYTARLKKWQGLAPHRRGMATAAQLAMIETDYDQLRWYWAPKGFGNMELALRSFVKHIAGVSDLRFLSFEKAVQIITTIKKMEARRELKEEAHEKQAERS